MCVCAFCYSCSIWDSVKHITHYIISKYHIEIGSYQNSWNMLRFMILFRNWNRILWIWRKARRTAVNDTYRHLKVNLMVSEQICTRYWYAAVGVDLFWKWKYLMSSQNRLKTGSIWLYPNNWILSIASIGLVKTVNIKVQLIFSLFF